MNCYSVPKLTGTHADALAAIGAASLLRRLSPRIIEHEDKFEIQLRRVLMPSDVDTAGPGFSYFERPGRKSPLRAADHNRITCAQASDGRTYSILGRMKAYGGPNQVALRFARMKPGEWEKSVWESLHGMPSFPFSGRLVQLFNPQSANGYARLKPSGASRRDKTKDGCADPFLEWLRFRGYFEGAAGWFASGDLRLYCPVPSDIPYTNLIAAVAFFRQLPMGGSAVKMDCRAVLGLARLLVKSEVRRAPAQSIGGLWVTTYKDMGQAHTVMAMERLALPDWLDLRNSEDARLWLRIIEEHDTALRRLDDSHSDEFLLLKQYRRTLQANRQESIAEFVEFLAGYSALLFRRRAEGHWLLPQFTVGTVAPIVSCDRELKAVLDNPGFRAVAAAIRGATLGPQAARRNERTDHRAIRYGLFSEILRAARLGRPRLMQTVAGFIDAFNREAARRRARGLPSASIRDWELQAFRIMLEHARPGIPAGEALCALSACLPGAPAAVECKEEALEAVPA